MFVIVYYINDKITVFGTFGSYEEANKIAAEKLEPRMTVKGCFSIKIVGDYRDFLDEQG